MEPEGYFGRCEIKSNLIVHCRWNCRHFVINAKMNTGKEVSAFPTKLLSNVMLFKNRRIEVRNWNHWHSSLSLILKVSPTWKWEVGKVRQWRVKAGLEKEVILRKWNRSGGLAGKNFAIGFHCVCFGIYFDKWKGIIPLHVKFSELPNVAYSFNSLFESVHGFNSGVNSFLCETE